jgi:hypothetical protein
MKRITKKHGGANSHHFVKNSVLSYERQQSLIPENKDIPKLKPDTAQTNLNRRRSHA